MGGGSRCDGLRANVECSPSNKVKLTRTCNRRLFRGIACLGHALSVFHQHNLLQGRWLAPAFPLPRNDKPTERNYSVNSPRPSTTTTAAPALIKGLHPGAVRSRHTSKNSQ